MQSTPGISHFLSQADGVAIAILAVLLVMSLASWTLIVTRTLARRAERRRAEDRLARLAAECRQAGELEPALKRELDDVAGELESGLTVLASVGSTAPFVGLFGTVWGVYQALVAIGTSGTASMERVAGPVGEALLMTAFGLAVAIPAVLAYNGFVRGNRVLLSRLESRAHALARQGA